MNFTFLGYCLAVEEQGRKTLHTHILLFMKDWDELLDGLGDIEKRDEYSKILTSYVDSISSNKMNELIETHVFKCESCMDNSSKIDECSDQCLRNLRTAKGSTEFGGKNIIKCTNCERGYSSDDLVMKNLDRYLNLGAHMEDSPFDYETLWNQGQKRSKYQVSMEIKLMNQLFEEMDIAATHPHVKPVKYRSDAYNDGCFLVTALRNHHRQNHVSACFKPGECECQMKIPSRKCETTTLRFEKDPVDWYEWNGKNTSRHLFICEHKRSHCDCFVNRYNEVISKVFNCNSNILTGLSGGAMLYITMYASKNNFDEDTKDYANAGKRIIAKIRENYGDSFDEMDDLQRRKRDLHAILGACTLTTRSHKVSAPLASYIVRNGSRF